ncbi:MAG: hypothetical protein QM763_11575 [Agriterribacter sp.]
MLEAVGKTAERFIMLASAWRRKGFITSTRKEKIYAYLKSAHFYNRAFKLDEEYYYPFKNYVVTGGLGGNTIEYLIPLLSFPDSIIIS